MEKYSQETEATMKKFYGTLNEKDKRRYAAMEAAKLGYGGQKYMCEILGCDAGTVKRGKEELQRDNSEHSGRIRRPGGGCKRIRAKIEDIDKIFLEIVRDHTAGSPMDEEIKWTNLGQRAISKVFKEKGYKVSEHVVKQLLKKHKYVQRKMHTTKTVKETALRNEQFQNIKEISGEYAKSENPIISIDVKKKS